MSEPTKAIFLSYSSQDADDAQRITDALRVAGLEVWFDQSELRGGDAWDAAIRKQIKECALFVPVISANTDARSEGYFRLEWKLAVDRSHLMADDQTFLLPVVIDDTLEPTARVPDKFRERQWSRLKDDDAIAAFAEQVKHLLLVGKNLPAGRDPAQAPALPVHEKSSSRAEANGARAPHFRAPRAIRTRLIGALLGVLLLAGAGLWAFVRSGINPHIESIAVLPFINASGNEDVEYLSDGMTETLIGSLSQLPKLNVKARSSVFRYKGKEFDLAKIARELKVQAILTGRIVQRGDDLTLSLELVNTQTENAVWSEKYNRKLAELVTLQSEIARDVSSKLKIRLSGADNEKLAKTYTTNPAAYQLYLKGNYHTSKYSNDGFRKGIEYFRQAIAADPGFALPYSGLAFNYINSEDWFMAPNEAAPKAREAARKALAIDDALGEAHLSLAIIAFWYEWDWAAAEREFKRTIELNPNDPRVYLFYSWYLAAMKRQEQAIASAKHGQFLDPVSAETNFSVGAVLVFARQSDRAIEQLRSAIDLDPGFWYSHYFLGLAFIQKGRLAEALVTFQRALELEKDNAENWANLGYAYALLGRKGEALQIIDYLKKRSAEAYVAPYNLAVIHAGLGDKDQSFAWLDRAYQERSSMLAIYLGMDVRFDGMRNDPRFNALVRRVGLPQ